MQFWDSTFATLSHSEKVSNRNFVVWSFWTRVGDPLEGRRSILRMEKGNRNVKEEAVVQVENKEVEAADD
jgi:hypothetical protein